MKKHQKHDKNKELVELETKTIEKIKHLNRKLSKKSIEQCSDEFFLLVKEFFSKFLGFHHQFTYEEIINELKHKRIDPRLRNRSNKFLTRLIHIEYSNISIGTERLRELCQEFKYIVQKLISIEKFEKKKHFIIPEKLIKELIDKTKIITGIKFKKVQEPKKLIKEINALLSEAQEAIKHKNILKAREIYQKIDDLYIKLPLDDKKRIYDRIFLVYKKKNPIYELLNKAYAVLKNDNVEEAKKIYSEIKENYEKLPDKQKKRIYSEIIKVYRPKKIPDIGELIEEGYYFLAKKKIKETKIIYDKMSEIYKEIPLHEKEKLYPKIMAFYNDIKEIFS